MNQENINTYLRLIQTETAPAMGCTEPAAVALCAAAAAAQLGKRPEYLAVDVSEYIFKNAMNVGIPGVDAVGLDIAAAMGAVCAQPEKGLLVLNGLTPEERSAAEALLRDGKTTISIVQGGEKVYIHAYASADGDQGEAVIQSAHTNFVLLKRNDAVTMKKEPDGTAKAADAPAPAETGLTIASIWDFVQEVRAEELSFLKEVVQLNSAISKEGLTGEYGLQVGRKMQDSARVGLIAEDVCNYAVAVTAAAADARMSGCEKAVMSVAGSGNQGLTATLPIIAAAEKAGKSDETLLKALSLSILTTIHAKEYIGRLSVLCGCSIASAIGVTAGIIYMYGGGLREIELGIKTMTADISGMVCDGAKPGCALKIATSVSAAMRAATLALSGTGATSHDGIVAGDVEMTLKNLGELGLEGMADTNRTILDMLLHKEPERVG